VFVQNCDSRDVWLSVDFMLRAVFFFGVVIFIRFSDLIDCSTIVGDVLSTDLISKEFPTCAASEKKMWPLILLQKLRQ